MKIMSSTVAYKEFYNILKQVNKDHQPVMIKGLKKKITQSLSARKNGTAYKKH